MISSFSPSRNLLERLAQEIKVSGEQGLIPLKDSEHISNALLGKKNDKVDVELLVPSEITANVRTQLADLSYLRCSKCGNVYNLNNSPQLLKNARCRNCNGPLVAAPIWAITAKRITSLGKRRITTTQGIKLLTSIEEYSKIQEDLRNKGIPNRIKIRDRSRPISSLLFEYKSKTHEPIPAYKLGAFDYMLSLMPSEGITKPITITAFAYDRNNCKQINITTGKLNGISSILFCDNLEIIQATLLYRAGHHRSSVMSRVVVLDTLKSSMTSKDVIRIPVRYIKTKGLVIKVEENTIKPVIKSLGYTIKDKWIALHTISHAFLVNLPQITGLEGSDFGEAISSGSDEVAIFDNSLGGLGGIEGIVNVSDALLEQNYEWSVRESHRCPLACIKACKACLYTDSCFMINWKLDRRILEKLGW